MFKDKQMWHLKGIYKNKPFEHISKDIIYLQCFQTLVLRSGGNSFIFKGKSCKK